MSDPQRLSEIQTRLDDLPVSNWEVDRTGDWPGVVDLEGKWIVADWGAWLDVESVEAIADFIAASPDRIAFLLSEVRALTERINKAPHARACNSWFRSPLGEHEYEPCNCWKSGEGS